MWKKDQIAQMKADLTGKKIAKVDLIPEEGSCPSYWVFTFEDDSEISFKFMAELA